MSAAAMRRPRKHWFRYSLLFVLLILVIQVWPAPVHAAGVTWGELSEQEKGVLKHLKTRWNKFPGHAQKKMQRWARQPSGKRSHIKKRFREWSALSRSRQGKIKSQLQRYKRMSPAKRLKLKAWWRWVKRLPKHEQTKLHQKLPGMSESQRKQYIQGLEKKYGKR